MVATVSEVAKLRAETGAGIMACKRALEECSGDLDAAIAELRKEGLAKAAQKATRPVSEGLIEAYIHVGGKIGVLVEVNCETDFVARTADFKEFVHNVAMQVAAMNPTYITREEVTREVVAEELEILRAQAEKEGKPAHIVDRIVEGRLEKFYESCCLLDQPWLRDTSSSVGEMLNQQIAKLGENIVIRRFVKYVLGE